MAVKTGRAIAHSITAGTYQPKTRIATAELARTTNVADKVVVLRKGVLPAFSQPAGGYRPATRIAAPLLTTLTSITAPYAVDSKTGVRPQPTKVGPRKPPVFKGYSFPSTIGTIVAAPIVEGNRKYAILGKPVGGKRIQHSISVSYTPATLQATSAGRIVKVLTGISTIGIGYNPTPPTPEATPIRKYPRDWHGENMH
jgi:hypothetical protein